MREGRSDACHQPPPRIEPDIEQRDRSTGRCPAAASAQGPGAQPRSGDTDGDRTSLGARTPFGNLPRLASCSSRSCSVGRAARCRRRRRRPRRKPRPGGHAGPGDEPGPGRHRWSRAAIAIRQRPGHLGTAATVRHAGRRTAQLSGHGQRRRSDLVVWRCDRTGGAVGRRSDPAGLARTAWQLVGTGCQAAFARCLRSGVE